MKIAIIGGGWVGCHLSYKLMNNHDVTLYEKNSDIFKETSYNNQNRLHLGFHYARNSKTRNLCRDTFGLFMSDYGHLTSNIENGLYCIPDVLSIIDFDTYLEIFKSFEFSLSKSKLLKNIEGSIKVDERYISFEKSNLFFRQKLKDIVIHQNVQNIKDISSDYNMIINATNNHLNPFGDYFFELTITLVYQKKKDVDFGSLTFVDGQLFSIFPYKDDLYTLTDVEHTPIKTFKNSSDIKSYIDSDEFKDIQKIKQIFMEKKVKRFFPEFNDYFEYNSFFLSTKSKIVSESDTRYPVFNKKDNIINCFTGKIQGIYIIENYIKNEIDNW